MNSELLVSQRKPVANAATQSMYIKTLIQVRTTNTGRRKKFVFKSCTLSVYADCLVIHFKPNNIFRTDRFLKLVSSKVLNPSALSIQPSIQRARCILVINTSLLLKQSGKILGLLAIFIPKFPYIIVQGRSVIAKPFFYKYSIVIKPIKGRGFS